MHYPDTVQVGAASVKVRVHNSFILGTHDGKHIVGKYDGKNRTIDIIDDGDHKELTGETFVHELVEAVNSIYQLELDHRVIATLGVGLYQALTSGQVSFKQEGNEGNNSNDVRNS